MSIFLTATLVSNFRHQLVFENETFSPSQSIPNRTVSRQIFFSSKKIFFPFPWPPKNIWSDLWSWVFPDSPTGLILCFLLMEEEDGKNLYLRFFPSRHLALFRVVKRVIRWVIGSDNSFLSEVICFSDGSRVNYLDNLSLNCTKC